MVPCNFLVAALGTADTNPHRAAVSLIELGVSILGWISSREALADRQSIHPAAAPIPSRRIRITYWLGRNTDLTYWPVSGHANLFMKDIRDMPDKA